MLLFATKIAYHIKIGTSARDHDHEQTLIRLSESVTVGIDMFDLLTVGHFAIDFIILPRKRQDEKPTLGGPPAYTSLAAKMLGARVSVLSKVGRDFPADYLDRLIRQDIDIAGLRKVDDCQTTTFVLRYSEDGSRNINLKSKAPPINSIDIPKCMKANVVHIAPIANEVSVKILPPLRNMGTIVSLDPQGFLRRFDSDGNAYLTDNGDLCILEGVNILKASQEEMESLTGEVSLKKAFSRVMRRGVEIMIATKGREGSILYNKGKIYAVPPAPAKVVDTTGLGDVFIGAFLAEFLKQKEPVWCACVGSAAASFVSEKIGPEGFANKKLVYEKATSIYRNVSILWSC